MPQNTPSFHCLLLPITPQKHKLFPEIIEIKMNMSTSESGWTMYFDQSSVDEKWSYMGVEQHEEEEEEEHDDDEDLSMVSDASSGPRQKFDEEDEELEKQYGEKRKTRLKKEKKGNTEVDDTASSSVFTYMSKTKSGLLKKASSVVEKCASKKKPGADNGVARKKGGDFVGQGSRELGSTNAIAGRLNLKY